MSKKIAFVDDSRSILKTIEILLKQKIQTGAIEVETFSKPMEFLENIEARAEHFDCLFLDINMPALSGYDVLKRLKELDEYKGIPIIALTTESSQEAQAKGKELGFDDWLIKINAPTTFLKSICAILDRFFPGYDAIKSVSAPTARKEDPMAEVSKLFSIIEELNKKLIMAEENKSRFLSLIYNEFNNPLLSVTMLMKDIIDDKAKTKEDIVESIEMIYADILTLNNQLSNILAAAEIESTTAMEKTPSHFNMTGLIQDIIVTQQSIYQDKKIVIEEELQFPNMIFNDREKIFLIFRNLIENAFEFSPEECGVFVSGRVENKHIVLVIKNRGNKICETTRMYDAFYQERSDFSRIHHGLGLGLAIVKHYVNFLGGLVLYCGDEEYNIFKITLPLEIDATQLESDMVRQMSFEEDANKGAKF